MFTSRVCSQSTLISVLPKLEYQPNFGHEKLTCSETARLWLSSYIRQNTKLICGRINVFNSKLFRVDELSISDILQQGAGFHPAQGMKMVFQVFQALKRLPEAKFILCHKSGEIHGCLYKSVMNEWMNVYLYTAHITWCLMAVYNAIEWDRTSDCEGASGCRYQSIFDLTHPPSPCMKFEIDHHTGNIVPYSFRQVRGFFNVPC